MGMFADLMHKIFSHAPTPPPAPPTPPPAPPAAEEAEPVEDEELEDEELADESDGDGEEEPTDEELDAEADVGEEESLDDDEAEEDIEGAAEAGPEAAPEVDVTSILDGLNAKHRGEHLDWRKSIVDMLKLVGMDSSLTARRELAKDLGYTGSHDDSAAMNVWLHKAVIKQLAEHGGTVPPELLH